jgi:hypothetical protein
MRDTGRSRFMRKDTVRKRYRRADNGRFRNSRSGIPADQGTVGEILENRMILADHHREGELLAVQGTIGGIPADPGTERGILTEHNIAGEILAYCWNITIRLKYCTA